jgi:hypothetical protein
MKKNVNFKDIDTKDLAGLICQNFKEDGIEAILVGGSCVTIYSNNRYMSADLDYVTYEELKKVERSLKKIGFVKNGKYFEHPDCALYIDFLTEPVAIGNEIIKEFEEIKTKYGVFKLLTVADCVKDRLFSFYHWDDRQGLNQAVEVCLDHSIDMKRILEWSKKEGFEQKFMLFDKELKKRKKELREPAYTR